MLKQTGSILLLLFLFSNGLFTPPSWSAPAPSQEEKSALDALTALSASGDLMNATLKGNEFLVSFPDSSLRDKVYFILGDSYYKQNQKDLARGVYKKLIDQFPASPLYPQALEKTAEIAVDQGLWAQAEKIYAGLVDTISDPKAQRDIYEKLIDLAGRRGDYKQTVSYLMDESEVVRDPEGSQLIRAKIASIIQVRMNKEDLQDVIESYPKEFPGDAAYLKLAAAYEEEKDPYHFEKTVRKFMEAFPKSESANLLKEKLALMKDSAKRKRINIGVLVSGEKNLAGFSAQVINGAQLAMDDFSRETHNDSVGMVVQELGPLVTRNAAEAETFLRDYSIKAVIGPMLSSSFQGMGALAESQNVPFVTPAATNPGVTSRSRFLFRNALTNMIQAKEIADYAIAKAGLKRFVVIAPKSKSGDELTKAFIEEATRLGGEIIDVEIYEPGTTDFTQQIKHLVKVDLGKYGIQGEKVETKDYKNRQKREYKPGFDGVFLPGEGVFAGLIPSQLAFFDISEVALLGSSGWNSPDFLKAGNKYAEGGVFVDGFFAGSDSPPIAKFVADYRKRFQSEPTLFSAQSYDTTRMILQVIKGGATLGYQIRTGLLEMPPYEGVTGLTKFNPNGEAEKKVFIIEIRSGSLHQIN